VFSAYDLYNSTDNWHAVILSFMALAHQGLFFFRDVVLRSDLLVTVFIQLICIDTGIVEVAMCELVGFKFDMLNIHATYKNRAGK